MMMLSEVEPRLSDAEHGLLNDEEKFFQEMEVNSAEKIVKTLMVTFQSE